MPVKTLGYRVRANVIGPAWSIGIAAVVTLCACLDTSGTPEAFPLGKSLDMWAENQGPASADWDYGKYGAPDSLLGGYGLPISLHQGDTLHVFVMARRPPLTTAVYRLGWYDGDG